VTVAAIAVAPTMPIPGTVSIRLLASLARCCAPIRREHDADERPRIALDAYDFKTMSL